MPLLYQENRGHPKAAKVGWLRVVAGGSSAAKLIVSRHIAAARPVSCASPLTLRILQAAVKQVVLPDAVDAEIFARVAFAHEAGIFQQPDRGRVGRDAGGFQPVQPQRGEGERDQRAHRRRHEAVAHIRKPHPIAEAAGLGDAAADIGERQAADERAVGAAEERKA